VDSDPSLAGVVHMLMTTIAPVHASTTITSPPGGRATNYWDELVYARGYPRNHRLFVHIARGRGSVLLCLRCDTLCTSGFVDDVMSSYNGPYGSIMLPQQQRCNVA